MINTKIICRLTVGFSATLANYTKAVQMAKSLIYDVRLDPTKVKQSLEKRLLLLLNTTCCIFCDTVLCPKRINMFHASMMQAWSHLEVLEKKMNYEESYPSHAQNFIAMNNFYKVIIREFLQRIIFNLHQHIDNSTTGPAELVQERS